MSLSIQGTKIASAVALITMGTMANGLLASSEQTLSNFKPQDQRLQKLDKRLYERIVFFESELNHKVKQFLSKKTQFANKKPDETLSLVVLFDKPISNKNTAEVSLKGQVDSIALHNHIKPVEPIKSFKHIPVFYFKGTKEDVYRLLSDNRVKRIGLDVGGSGNLLQAIPQVKIDSVQQQFSVDGSGIQVAVLDSGIDTDHADLSGQILSQKCFADTCPNGADNAEDDHGHGTHVASIIGGQGNVAPAGGATGVDFHVVKVLDSSNSFSSTSIIVSALDYVISDLTDVNFVNMSLGTSARFSGFCDDSETWTAAMASGIDTLRNRGVLSFVSSGNDADHTAIQAPACVENAVAVGAIWDSSPSSYSGSCVENNPQAGELACFSNSSSAIDIVAPGSPITASGVGGGTAVFNGTSMAAPLTLSCAALIKSGMANLTADQIETAIKTATAISVTDDQGLSHPSLDCLASYQDLVVDAPPTVSISSPSDNAELSVSAAVSFSGSASDNEDGDLTANIQWLNGQTLLATGASFSQDFIVGSYSITAQVTDSSNQTVGEEVSFSVVANLSPTISISSPSQAQNFDENESITFTASASDAEDGDISSSILWRQGTTALGTGASITHSFSAGSYTITAEITDSSNATASVNVVIVVNEESSSGGKGGGGAMFFLLGLLGLMGFRKK